MRRVGGRGACCGGEWLCEAGGAGSATGGRTGPAAVALPAGGGKLSHALLPVAGEGTLSHTLLFIL